MNIADRQLKIILHPLLPTGHRYSFLNYFSGKTEIRGDHLPFARNRVLIELVGISQVTGLHGHAVFRAIGTDSCRDNDLAASGELNPDFFLLTGPC